MITKIVCCHKGVSLLLKNGRYSIVVNREPLGKFSPPYKVLEEGISERIAMDKWHEEIRKQTEMLTYQKPMI